MFAATHRVDGPVIVIATFDHEIVRSAAAFYLVEPAKSRRLFASLCNPFDGETEGEKYNSGQQHIQHHLVQLPTERIAHVVVESFAILYRESKIPQRVAKIT